MAPHRVSHPQNATLGPGGPNLSCGDSADPKAPTHPRAKHHDLSAEVNLKQDELGSRLDKVASCSSSVIPPIMSRPYANQGEPPKRSTDSFDSVRGEEIRPKWVKTECFGSSHMPYKLLSCWADVTAPSVRPPPEFTAIVFHYIYSLPEPTLSYQPRNLPRYVLK